MLTNETATLSEVAAALGRPEGWLRRKWLTLHRVEGFPRKLSSGWVWPRRQVEAWLRAGGAAPVVLAPANDDLPADALLHASAALADRYGGRS